MAGGLGFPSWATGGGHYRYECKHGVLISQCRCPGGSVTIMDCPERCTAKDETPEGETE